MKGTTDLRDVLEMAAKSCRKPVGACQIYDPNVCTFRFEQGWQPVATSGFPFTRHFSMTRAGRKVAIFANPDFVLIEISGERSGPAFCVGHADKISYWQESGQFVLGQQSWPVYIPANTEPSKELGAALKSKLLKTAVSEVMGQSLSRLHLYRDGAKFYFQPRDAAILMAAIKSLLPLTTATKAAKVLPGVELMPEDLRELLPLAKHWAESDDFERSQLLERASRRSLEKLVKMVEPHLGAIDKYLSSFGAAPLPESATALGTLAECTIEAELTLRRNKQRSGGRPSC